MRPISPGKHVRKQGPLEIGLKESFEPADYGDAGAKGLHDGTTWVERIPPVDLEDYKMQRKEGMGIQFDSFLFVQSYLFLHVGTIQKVYSD